MLHIVSYVCLFLQRVSAVNSLGWLDSLTEPPLLQSSPAAQFLTSYFPDGVGLSPTLNDWKQNAEDSTGMHSEELELGLFIGGGGGGESKIGFVIPAVHYVHIWSCFCAIRQDCQYDPGAMDFPPGFL